MDIEIIAVGDEVVKGHTVNTNATYIAKRMSEYGLDTMYHTAVCDSQVSIKEAVDRAIKRSDTIFIIGGLGPTADDLTKETVCECIGEPLIFFEEIYKDIEAYFEKGGRTTPKNNKKQAYFPENSIILENDYGTAPGCILKYMNKQIILLPGPPKELIPMVENKVIPCFENEDRDTIVTTDIKVFGLGESHLAEKLGNQLGVFKNYTVATYVGNDEIIVRIRGWSNTKEAAEEICNEVKKNIHICLKEYIIGYNNSQLEESVVALLRKESYTVATAESCTGGLLASTLINCSGVSSVLEESIVTYSNAAKMKYLDVKEKTLEQYGAVSAQTAKEMARGIKKQAQASVGLATTGIAGPDGGTATKPVGTVYIGIAIGEACYTYHLQLEGTRQEIRQKTVKNILYQLYKHLK